jgi:hypothetical protein
VDRQVWVCIPIAGAQYLSYALIINTDDGLCGSRELPNVASVDKGTINPAGAVAQESWEDDTGIWSEDTTIWTQSTFSSTNDSLMMTQPLGSKLLAVGIDSTADGQPITSVMERQSLRIQEGVRHTVMTQLAPRIEGNPGDIVGIRIGYQNYLAQPITWLPERQFTIGASRAISQIVDGRYISVQFSVTSLHEWKMYGYFIKVKEAGEY